MHITLRHIKHNGRVLHWIKQFVINLDVLCIEEEAKNRNLEIGLHKNFYGVFVESSFLNGKHFFLGHNTLPDGKGILGHEGVASITNAGYVVCGGRDEGRDGEVTGT